jgi:alpha-mannosidase/mannosylglycerate hydrolase
MDTKPLSETSLMSLHVIPLLRWEREGVETFESRRAWLMDMMARLLDVMGASGDIEPLRYCLLGGQTVLLEDVSSVRPELVTLLVIYNAGGRLGIGPWYVNADRTLVSGESLIRNLLLARADAARYGVKLMPIAYGLEDSEHPAQLPQILRGFGIGAALLRDDHPARNAPFRWESLDGSSVLVIHQDMHSNPHGQPDVKTSVIAQQLLRPEGPYLWLLNFDEVGQAPKDTLAYLESQAGVDATQSDLSDYVRALRRSIHDNRRPVVKGALRSPTNRPLPGGSLSARISLKQQNALQQARLTYGVEPWLAIAQTHGQRRSDQRMETLRALTDHAWRLLIRNQARTALGGLGVDRVHQDNETRYLQIEDNAAQVIAGALEMLPGKPLRATFGAYGSAQSASEMRTAARTATYVVVWNAHNWSVRQPVELALHLPDGRYPLRLRTPGSDEEQMFCWSPPGEHDDHSGVLSFLADAPAVGYAAYTLELSDSMPEERFLARTEAGGVIGSVTGERLSAREGALDWLREQGNISDVLRFFDGGDAGDAGRYFPPRADVITQAAQVEDVRIESSPIYERLLLHHRMRIAPSLRPDRSRDRGLKAIDLYTTATFYDHIPGVYFRTTFENSARDHRLRVHLRTGITSERVIANGVFGASERLAVGTFPIQTACAIGGAQGAMALLARGLPEVEAIPEDDQSTLALTLVRAVGWLNRNDLGARADGPMLAVPGAQMQRSLTASYALYGLPGADRAALMRAAQEYDAPVQAYQYETRPERPRRSFLSVLTSLGRGDDSDGQGAILTALKPPQRGKGWIVRLLNPHDRPVEVFLLPHTRPEHVQLLNLAEESQRYLETDGNGRITLAIEPQQLVTVRISFE